MHRIVLLVCLTVVPFSKSAQGASRVIGPNSYGEAVALLDNDSFADRERGRRWLEDHIADEGFRIVRDLHHLAKHSRNAHLRRQAEQILDGIQNPDAANYYAAWLVFGQYKRRVEGSDAIDRFLVRHQAEIQRLLTRYGQLRAKSSRSGLDPAEKREAVWIAARERDLFQTLAGRVAHVLGTDSMQFSGADSIPGVEIYGTAGSWNAVPEGYVSVEIDPRVRQVTYTILPEHSPRYVAFRVDYQIRDEAVIYTYDQNVRLYP